MRAPSSNPSFASAAEAIAAGETWLTTFARSVAGRLWGWLQKRRVLAELRKLDDWTLYDLRISRADFRAIAEGSYRRGDTLSEAQEAPRAAPVRRVWPL
jgi:uncharacterized protein YjiS (DUF1127 family)